MSRIFISYRKRDRRIMLAFREHLQEAGFEVWSDMDLPTGDRFPEVIDRQLRAADAVVILWSRESVHSKWVYFEALMATRMLKAFPIRVNRCNLPRTIEERHFEDFLKLDFQSEEWRDIVEKLRRTATLQSHSDHVASLEELSWNEIRKSTETKDFEDFIDRYPTGRFRHDAEKNLATLKPKLRRRIFFWSMLGLITYVGLLLPFAGLFHDYPPEGVRLWSMLYFNFFMFFVIFGVLMVPIYYFTLYKALSFSQALSFRGRPARSWQARLAYLCILVVAPAGISATVSYIEVTTGYAPWQFSRGTLQTPVSQLDRRGVPLRTVAGQPDATTEKRSLEEIFARTRDLNLRAAWELRNPTKSDPCIASPSFDGETRPFSECQVHMNNLQQIMTHVMENPATRSWTGYLYAYSFFFFALMFMGSYINIFFLCTHSEQMRIWLARLSPWSGERFSQILKLLGIQLACISVWFVARMMFQLETNTILPSRGSSEATQAIRNGYYLFLAVYLLAIGFVVTAAYRINSWSIRVIITGIAFLTSLFLGSAFMGTSFLQLLGLFIGPQANAGSTAVFSMVLFVILLPLVVPNFFAASEDSLIQLRPEDEDRATPQN